MRIPPWLEATMETARPGSPSWVRLVLAFQSAAALARLRAHLPTVRGRLALFAALCAGLAMLVLTALLFGYAAERRAMIEQQIQKEAAAITHSIDRELAVNIARLEGLATSAALRSGDMEAVFRQVKSLVLPPRSTIQLYDRDATGRRRVFFNTALPWGTPPAPQRSAESDRLVEQFIADVFTTRAPQVTDVIISNISGLPITAAGVPVIIDDQVRYVFVVVLPAMDSAPIFGPAGLPENWISGVIDRNGRYVAGHRSPERAANLPVIDAAFREALAEGETLFPAYTRDDRALYVTVSRSDKTGWLSIVGIPRAELDAPWYRALTILGIAGSTLLLAAVALAFVAEPRIAWPLRRRLIEGEERFRAVAHTVPSILFSTDVDGRCDYASDAFYAHTGQPAGAAGDFGWTDALHPDDRPRALAMLASAFGAARSPVDDGPTGETEIRLRAADGAYRWFLMRARAGRDADGRASRCFGTITDIDALKRTERELRAVSGQLMRTQDDERRRIAREIHDSTLQDLVAVSLTVEQISRGTLDAEETEAAVGEIRATITRSSGELRTLSYLLHPPLLDELGLPAAIRWYAQGFEKRSAIRLTMRLPETMTRLPDEIATALFRVVQEGLGNVYRHSGSSEAVVALAQTAHSVELEIIDYGRGMRPLPTAPDVADPVTLGVGIPGMRLRLNQIGGTLDISTGPGGTTVRASVPFTAPRETEAAGEA